MYLSVIIPAFNEEKRIGNTLSGLRDFFKLKSYDYEIIIVDDGSCDNTKLVVEGSELFSAGRLKIFCNETNKGKGSSVKRGIENSTGDYVLFSDADLSTPIEEVDKLLAFTDKGYDIVIGSRNIADSAIEVHQPWYREFMGKVFNLFVKAVLLNDFNDTQCGFKLFKGPVARNITEKLIIEGFCFDVEMLYLAKQNGYKVKEVGVTWKNSPQSKVGIINSSLSMFVDLVRIRSIHK